VFACCGHGDTHGLTKGDSWGIIDPIKHSKQRHKGFDGEE
jgi:hypothetical protein